jgi:hypothetical protein
LKAFARTFVGIALTLQLSAPAPQRESHIVHWIRRRRQHFRIQIVQSPIERARMLSLKKQGQD